MYKVMCVCLQLPSNQSFYRKITGHGMSIGGHGQTNQFHVHDIIWGALDHASYAPQLMSCNYYTSTCTCVQFSGIILQYTGVSIA